MSLTIDTSRWPLVRVEFHGDLTIVDELEYEEQLAGFLKAGERFAILESGEPSGSGERRALADRMRFLRSYADQLKEQLAGVAVISTPEAIEMMNSHLEEGKAKNILKLIVYPQKPFVRENNAIQWLQDRLTAGPEVKGQ